MNKNGRIIDRSETVIFVRKFEVRLDEQINWIVAKVLIYQVFF